MTRVLTGSHPLIANGRFFILYSYGMIFVVEQVGASGSRGFFVEPNLPQGSLLAPTPKRQTGFVTYLDPDLYEFHKR